MSALFTLANQAPVQSNGRPYGLARLYFYRAGTTTHQEVFTTIDLDVAHDQPVEADSAGQFPPIFLNPIADFDYRYQLKTSADVLIEDIDDYPRTDTVAGSAIRYDQTPAEAAAVVTPTNFEVVNDYTGLIIPDRFLTNTTPGTTDMTAAMQSALAVLRNNGFGEIKLLGKQYLVSDIAFKLLSTDSRIKITGIPERSVIVNKAGASKPSIQIFGSQFFEIDGIVFIGAATFSNYGIELIKDGSGNRSGNGSIRRIVCQTNGHGVHIQDTNTVVIDDYRYWPSGGSTYGGSADANNIKGAILANGTGAVNSIYLTDINASNYTTIANGGCAIRVDGSSSAAAFQDWKIDGLNAELAPVTTQRAIWMTHAFNAIINNIFTENSQVLFDNNSRNCSINIQAGASGTLALDGTTNPCLDMHIVDSVGLSFTADAANIRTYQENNSWSVAPGNADSSTNRTQVNVKTTGGVLEKDIFQGVTVGVWSTPSFAAGNYTATPGTWTVASGDVGSFRYKVDHNAKTMTINLVLSTTTTATAPVALNVAIPGGYTGAAFDQFCFDYFYTLDNGTTTSRGIARVQSGGTAINFYRDMAGTAFTNVTDLLGLKVSMTFEIA